MCRRSRRPPRRNHPPTLRPLLPLLRCGVVGDLARDTAVADIQITPDSAVDGRYILEGMRGDFPLYLLGIEKLMV